MSEIYGQLISASGSSKPYTQIIVTFPSGTTNITLTGNGKTWTAVSTSSTQNVYIVTDIGYTYTLSGSKDGKSKSEQINVSQAFQDIRIELSFSPEWYENLKTQSVGQTLSVDGYEWIIVNKTDSAAVLGLRYWYMDTVYDHTWPHYNVSELFSKCLDFEANTLSDLTKEYLNYVTEPTDTLGHYGTAKVFIPSIQQAAYSPTYFTYYATLSNRIFTTNTGIKKSWWTSSGNNVEYDQISWIDSNGYGQTYDRPYVDLGFRPHMEVNLTL